MIQRPLSVNGTRPAAAGVPLFRRATLADVDAVRALTRAAYAKWVAVIGREPLPMAADFGRAVREHAIDLLFDAGQLVGLVEMVAATDYLLIENIAVAPDQQGRGYGKLLMAHAECTAVALGVGKLRLYTNERFTDNIRFYGRLGYGVDRTEPFKGGTVVHMKKSVHVKA